MLVRHGHTYVAAADVPSLLRGLVRTELERAGFVDVSVRAADGDGYNTIGQGTWTGPDRNVELPDQVVWVHDVTPAEEPADAPPATGPVVTPTTSPAPTPSTSTTAPTTTRRRRRAAPSAPDPTVTVVSLVVVGLGAAALWKLKKEGFWDRRAWR